jgi:hypothetical protein
MAKSKTYRFTVEGSWDFPTDMLRYDHCYPVDTDSALEISRCRRCEGSYEGRSKNGKVHLMGSNVPTEERWKSFGWLVTSWVENRY